MPATVPDDSGMPNSSASACVVRSLDRNCPAYRYTMIAATRGPYCTGAPGALRDGGLGALPAPAFPLGQLMPGHLDRDSGQVEDLAALHPGDRPSRQPGPAPAAAARLMADLPVRPGHLRQRRPRMPVLPAGLTAAFLPQRPRSG